ncbi:MAG: acyl-CoA desaturase [Acidimicrobiia bacterium]|nr:acyl-CoA desaturase [Acidimicrobiia bacterium]
MTTVAPSETIRPASPAPVAKPSLRTPSRVDVAGVDPASEAAASEKTAFDDTVFDDTAFAAELDAVRQSVIDQLGENDAAYIRSIIRRQRRLEMGARAALMFPWLPPVWIAGAVGLGVAKIIDNMEIGHNVMHGQWDWMRDDVIHSTKWDWETHCPGEQWKRTHNESHHMWTNVVGKDHDIGYNIIRMDPNQPWRPYMLGQPVYFVLLGLLFQEGVALHEASSLMQSDRSEDRKTALTRGVEAFKKMARLAAKDYLLFPALALPFGLATAIGVAVGNGIANLIRNVWAFAVIFCGHFPEGVALFTESDIDGETQGQWYRRQVEGSANFTGGRLMDLLSGNLDHQIEHHLFPDLPSNYYSQIAPQVREICARHGVTYRTGSFLSQFGSVVRKTIRLAFPNKVSQQPVQADRGREAAFALGA